MYLVPVLRQQFLSWLCGDHEKKVTAKSARAFAKTVVAREQAELKLERFVCFNFFLLMYSYSCEPKHLRSLCDRLYISQDNPAVTTAATAIRKKLDEGGFDHHVIDPSKIKSSSLQELNKLDELSIVRSSEFQ